MNTAAEVIYDLVDPNANLIFGAVIDKSLSNQVSWGEQEITQALMIVLAIFDSR